MAVESVPIHRLKKEPWIEQLKNFRAGNMVGTHVQNADFLGVSTGWLDSDHRRALYNLMSSSTTGTTYIVFSYKTPIAWRKNQLGSQWWIPNLKHSVSTSRHQNIVRTAADRTTGEVSPGQWTQLMKSVSS